MKSVIEEASSISKAIENGWKRAGQPTEFTVRVFELPQKNMFGFTTKPAKIAIFFQEQSSGNNKKNEQRSHSTPTVRPITTQHAHAPREKHADALQSKEKAPMARRTTEKPRVSTLESGPWNKEMIDFTQEWLKTLLSKLHLQNSYTITPEHYHLKISFAKTIFASEDKNRVFFRNCAYLLLQSMRNKFKRALKGFKIVLTVSK